MSSIGNPSQPPLTSARKATRRSLLCCHNTLNDLHPATTVPLAGTIFQCRLRTKLCCSDASCQGHGGTNMQAVGAVAGAAVPPRIIEKAKAYTCAAVKARSVARRAEGSAVTRTAVTSTGRSVQSHNRSLS